MVLTKCSNLTRIYAAYVLVPSKDVPVPVLHKASFIVTDIPIPVYTLNGALREITLFPKLYLLPYTVPTTEV